MTLPTHLTYQLVIVISIHYQCAPFFPQSLVTTTTNLSAKDPMYSSLTFMGETHHQKNPSPCSLNDLCDEEVHHGPIQDSSHLYLSIMGELCCKYCHVSPYDKESMVNKDPPCDHFWERTHRTGKPQTKGALQSPPQTSHILEPKDGDYEDSQSLCPDGSVNNTDFRIPYMSSHHLLALRIMFS